MIQASALCSLNIDLFKDVPNEEIDGLEIDGQIHTFSAGQTIFNQEEKSKDVYFLMAGTVLAIFWTEDGKEIVFNRMETGTYLGELAALDNGERSLAVYARSETRTLIVKQECFLKLIRASATIRNRIINDLVGRIRDLTERNYQLSTFSVEQRLRSYLVRLALQTQQLVPNGLLENAPTHAEIASSIGANREAVSRTMTVLGKAGVLQSSRKKIEILNPNLLLDGL
jgi:CRP-like cAMP-binding protein